MPKRPYTGTVGRMILFCQVQQIAAGNALAAVWDYDTGGGETFNKGVKASQDGQEPATHICVNTIMDAEMQQGIESAVVQGTPWLTGYKESEGWTWDTALADMGLQVVQVEI